MSKPGQDAQGKNIEKLLDRPSQKSKMIEKIRLAPYRVPITSTAVQTRPVKPRTQQPTSFLY